jgi:AAA family ATP:ADP antiporter
VKLSDGSFKHSINRSGIELLSLPVPTEIKAKVKAFIDVFIDNLATGLAGALLILLTIVLNFSVAHISLLNIALIALWLIMILRVKDEYVNSFRLAIEKRSIDLEQQSLNMEDASVFKSIVKVLDSDNERQILYVLQLLEGVQNRDLVPYLEKLIKHPSYEVKARVLNMAIQFSELDLSTRARELIGAEDQSVRVKAIMYLCVNSDDKIDELSKYMDHDDYRVRGSAMICAARVWKDHKQLRNTLDLKKMIDDALAGIAGLEHEDEIKSVKASAAQIIGISGDPGLLPYLGILLNDDSPEVVQAAVTSAGQIRSEESVPTLLNHLQTKKIRRYARQSLAEYGEDVMDELVRHMEDPQYDVKIRRRIPGVLALIRSGRSVEALLNNLDNSDLSIRYEVMKALNKLRSKFPSLKMNRSVIEDRIFFEMKLYYLISVILFRQLEQQSARVSREHAADGSVDGNKARNLLTVALREKLDDTLERIFRLLGLRYLPEDMYNAFLGVTSDKPGLKADSVEFLDNVLKPELKKIIVPVIETDKPESLVVRAHELFGIEVPGEEESIDILLEGDDNWLKVCTLYLIAEMKWSRHIETVTRLAEGPHPVVIETSKYCLEKIGISD